MKRWARTRAGGPAVLAAALGIFWHTAATADIGIFRPLTAGMETHDIELATAAIHDALVFNASRATLAWVNQASGNSGSVTPLRTYRTRAGFYCRDFRVTLASSRYGDTSALRTACRDRDGQWKAAVP